MRPDICAAGCSRSNGIGCRIGVTAVSAAEASDDVVLPFDRRPSSTSNTLRMPVGMSDAKSSPAKKSFTIAQAFARPSLTLAPSESVTKFHAPAKPAFTVCQMPAKPFAIECQAPLTQLAHAEAPAFTAGQIESQLAATTAAAAATPVITKPTGPSAPAIATPTVRAAVANPHIVRPKVRRFEPKAITDVTAFPAIRAPMP